MRYRLALLTLSLYIAFTVLGCTKKPDADNGTTDTTAPVTQPAAAGGEHEAREAKEAKERKEHEEARKAPLVVPAGTEITISLGQALGSKLSQPGMTYTGSVAKDVVVGNEVAIPRGSSAQGTVTDAKALGKFAGGAVLSVRLDSITIHGANLPVQASAASFNEKGKGKRTAILAGGGAALGGIVGALAGGGKGAAIGAAAGAGAGGGGAAFTGNKEIVLPAESDLSFQLSQAVEVKR